MKSGARRAYLRVQPLRRVSRAAAISSNCVDQSGRRPFWRGTPATRSRQPHPGRSGRAPPAGSRASRRRRRSRAAAQVVGLPGATSGPRSGEDQHRTPLRFGSARARAAPSSASGSRRTISPGEATAWRRRCWRRWRSHGDRSCDTYALCARTMKLASSWVRRTRSSWSKTPSASRRKKRGMPFSSIWPRGDSRARRVRSARRAEGDHSRRRRCRAATGVGRYRRARPG